MDIDEIKKIVVRESLSANGTITAYQVHGKYHIMPVELLEAMTQLQAEGIIQYDAQAYRVVIAPEDIDRAETYVKENNLRKTAIEDKKSAKQMGLFEPYLPSQDIINEL